MIADIVAYSLSLQSSRPSHAQCRQPDFTVVAAFTRAFSLSLYRPNRAAKTSASNRAHDGSATSSSRPSIAATSWIISRIATALSIVPRRHAFSHGALHSSQPTFGKSGHVLFSMARACAKRSASYAARNCSTSKPSRHTIVQGASQSARWSLSRSSNAKRRCVSTSSVEVSICIPSIGFVEHEVIIRPLTLSLTTHTIQPARCSLPSAIHIAGMAIPAALASCQIVCWPVTSSSFPSMVIFILLGF